MAVSRGMRGRAALAALGLAASALLIAASASAAPVPAPASTPATPVHWLPYSGNARQVKAFNLLQNISGGLLEPLLCSGDFGCPNLGAFEAGKFNVKTGVAEASTLTSLVGNSGMPSLVMAWFEASAQNANITALQCDPNDRACVVRAAKEMLATNWTSTVDVQASGYLAGMAFELLLEYTDSNGDGVYDPNTDAFVSAYPLSLGSAHWGPMRLATDVATDGALVYTLNVTTLDGVVSIAYQTASSSVERTVQGSTVQLGPDDVKVSVEVKDYPFQAAGNSRLALQTLVLAAKGDAAIHTATPTSGDSSDAVVSVGIDSGVGAGSFSWSSTATAVKGDTKSAAAPAATTRHAPETVAVRPSPWQVASADQRAAMSRSLASVLGGGATVRSSFFTFDVVQPAYVMWDPTLSFKDPADAGNFATLIIICVGAATLAGMLVLAVWARRSYVRGSEEEDDMYRRMDAEGSFPLVASSTMNEVARRRTMSSESRSTGDGHYVTCDKCGYDANSVDETHCENCGSRISGYARAQSREARV